MKARYTIFAVVLTMLGASQASASIISASGQTQSIRPATQVSNLNTTSVQNDLNTTLRSVADETTPSTFTMASAPSNATGGVVLTSTGTANFGVVAGPTSPLFNPHHGSVNTSFHGPVTYGSHHHRRGGGGTKAAPEPSTWMLLATGLAMLGGGAILRRRVLV